VPAYTYDPAKVIVVVALPPIVIAPLEGFADGTMITAVRHKPEVYRMVHGVRGASDRVRVRHLSGRITFELEQAAPANALLSSAQVTDEHSAIGVGVVGIKDLSSLTDLVVSPQSWIVGVPEWERRTAAGTIRWQIDCKFLQIFHGGARQEGAPALAGFLPPGVPSPDFS
jgi:hypothetical protein